MHPLKKYRENNDITQTEMAASLTKKTGKNILNHHICRWENCTNMPSPSTAEAIARATGGAVQPDDLYLAYFNARRWEK